MSNEPNGEWVTLYSTMTPEEQNTVLFDAARTGLMPTEIVVRTSARDPNTKPGSTPRQLQAVHVWFLYPDENEE